MSSVRTTSIHHQSQIVRFIGDGTKNDVLLDFRAERDHLPVLHLLHKLKVCPAVAPQRLVPIGPNIFYYSTLEFTSRHKKPVAIYGKNCPFGLGQAVR